MIRRTASTPGRKPMSDVRTSRREWYAELRDRELCAWSCGSWAAAGRTLCEDCRGKGLAAQHRLLEHRLANQLCRECGAARDAEHTRCAGCRERRKLRPSRQHAYRVRNERGYAKGKR